MNASKIYPSQDPKHQIATGTKAQTFNGCARALLITEDIATIEWCLDNLTLIDGHDDVINLVIEAIGSVLGEGKERMNSLHSILGAYDVNENFQLTKPDSELKKHHPSVPNIRSLMANLPKEGEDGAA